MKKFTYPPITKFFQLMPLVIAIGMSLLVGCMVLVPGTGNGEAMSWPHTLATIAIFFWFLGGAWMISVQFPDIHIIEGSFRLKSWGYTTNWLSWYEIISIEEHIFSMRTSRMLIVRVQPIPAIYQILGLIHGNGSRGFLVRSNMQGYDEFITTLAEQCPHLKIDLELYTS